MMLMRPGSVMKRRLFAFHVGFADSAPRRFTRPGIAVGFETFRRRATLGARALPCFSAGQLDELGA